MQIVGHGLGCIELGAKTPSGEVRLVADPYQNTTGFRFPRTLEAEIVTQSLPRADWANPEAVGGNPFLISMPGEYEVRQLFVYGFRAPLRGGEEHTIYRYELDRLSLLHLGALDRKPTDEELEQVGDVDILVLPIGGGAVLGVSDAAELVQVIEPRIVIPIWYGESKIPLKEKDAKRFVSELGAKHVEETAKFKCTRAMLPEEDMQVILLSR